MAVALAISVLPVFFFLGALVLLDSYKLIPARAILLAVAAGCGAAAAGYAANRWLQPALGVHLASYSKFVAPTVEEVVAVDPTEAACSSRILPLLGEFFDVVAQRPYGGSSPPILLADVAQNFQPGDVKCWLQALIDADEDFERQDSQPPHFSCAIARLRPPASGAPSQGL